jgi:hypothetical protein
VVNPDSTSKATYYKVTKTNNIMAIDNITFPRLEEGSETLL